nr:immunoglobulin heavy chain junction region [Macaca mulatta]MOV38308.1 immunoglobulin heavy chain junction region [Macaca mulatta]MOV38479.1 immunoglobulin heavy chain junction region [Macaca mulatta]MOV38579.1 immunoglobulin heavy chain junction region [Macaca mulatta]MOV38630.1 immunoglobulin heavy chain junction region [Macaca mulatta]
CARGGRIVIVVELPLADGLDSW